MQTLVQNLIFAKMSELRTVFVVREVMEAYGKEGWMGREAFGYVMEVRKRCDIPEEEVIMQMLRPRFDRGNNFTIVCTSFFSDLLFFLMWNLSSNFKQKQRPIGHLILASGSLGSVAYLLLFRITTINHTGAQCRKGTIMYIVCVGFSRMCNDTKRGTIHSIYE